MAERLLRDAGITSIICTAVADLVGLLADATAFVVIAEEALVGPFDDLTAWIRGQPPWSDLPFVVLTHRSVSEAYHLQTRRLSEMLRNVTLIERPFHAITFTSVAKSALNARLRQYEVRTLIGALRESEETLERRVVGRTLELNLAHTAILAEIAQREQAEEKLRQSQKLEMIGQLTGGVAHDFNNLLMAVIGNLDLLRKRTSHDPTSERLIEGAIQGAQRGAALTQRLLAFARRQDLRIEPVDMGRLVEGMKELIRRSIGDQIELVVQIAPRLPPVMVDAIQVELAILNLVVNARDAMPNGGQIIVGLDLAKTDLGAAGPASYVRLSVIDTGIGMDAETLAKATEPFFSTKELGKGTGLGLSMIHGLARQLGGTLRLSSTVGQGTRAELLLPSTSAIVVPHVVPERADAEAVTERLSVLVVDDDALISMSTALMVEDLGHSVVEVNSGSAALEVLQAGTKIDLMITDFSMPKMNGAQLAKAARQARPGLPVLLATGYAEIPSGQDLGLTRISKPFLQEQLATAVREALQGKAVVGA